MYVPHIAQQGDKYMDTDTRDKAIKEITHHILELSEKYSNPIAGTIEALVLEPMHRSALDFVSLPTHHDGIPLQTHERLAGLCDVVIARGDRVKPGTLAYAQSLKSRWAYAESLKRQYDVRTGDRLKPLDDKAELEMVGEAYPIGRKVGRGAYGLMQKAQRLLRVVDQEGAPADDPRRRLAELVRDRIRRGFSYDPRL
jgi:hypothetical protein